MKTSVAITLIVVGAILIAIPPVSDYLHESNIVRLLEKPGTVTVHLDATKMSREYRHRI